MAVTESRFSTEMYSMFLANFIKIRRVYWLVTIIIHPLVLVSVNPSLGLGEIEMLLTKS